MARTPLSRPTDAELAILRILWARGPSTVREVHDVIAEGRDSAYTTTGKVLQVMTDKGLTTREEWGRIHRYSAAAPEEETQRQLVDDLVERAFGGSPVKMLMRALSSQKATAEELAEMRRLLAVRKDRKR
jgi:predicted transcriptional regulator